MDKNLRDYVKAVKIYDGMRPILKKKYRKLFIDFGTLLRREKLDILYTARNNGVINKVHLIFAEDWATNWVAGGGATFPWWTVGQGSTKIYLSTAGHPDQLLGWYPLEDFEEPFKIIKDIKTFITKLGIESEK